MSIICAHRNFTVFACDPFSASVTSQKVVVVVVIDTSCGKFCKVEVPFYCAMLLRDAMDSADYAVARCLSVRPSVRHRPVFCRNG